MSMFAEYIDAWKEKDTAIREKACQIQETLWRKFPDIAGRLKSLGAREVIVFGSLVEGDFRIDSDMDLAVKGLPEDKYLDALMLVEKILVSTGVDFDLVLYERAHPWIKERIEKGRKI